MLWSRKRQATSGVELVGRVSNVPELLLEATHPTLYPIPSFWKYVCTMHSPAPRASSSIFIVPHVFYQWTGKVTVPAYSTNYYVFETLLVARAHVDIIRNHRIIAIVPVFNESFFLTIDRYYRQSYDRGIN